MLISTIIFLAFISEKSRTWASILAGIGFGFFIDELGKFLTSDNNYFYQPTFVLIYAIFILIYFAARLIERYKVIDESEYIVNAIETYKLVYTGDFDHKDKETLRHILSEIKSDDPVIVALRENYKNVSLNKENGNIILRLKKAVFSYYEMLIEYQKIQSAVIAIFTIAALIGFIDAAWNLATNDEETYYMISRLAATFCVGVGFIFIKLKKDRIRGYQWLKYSVLISLFISQFFLFYHDQASAFFFFVIYLTLYLIIRGLIFEEETLHKVKKMQLQEA